MSVLAHDICSELVYRYHIRVDGEKRPVCLAACMVCIPVSVVWSTSELFLYNMEIGICGQLSNVL